MMKNTAVITVLGSGCPTCKKLFERTKQAVQELALPAEVKYITDVREIVALGVMSSPVLMISGKVICAGAPPDIEEIKKRIQEHL